MLKFFLQPSMDVVHQVGRVSVPILPKARFGVSRLAVRRRRCCNRHENGIYEPSAGEQCGANENGRIAQRAG